MKPGLRKASTIVLFFLCLTTSCILLNGCSSDNKSKLIGTWKKTSGVLRIGNIISGTYVFDEEYDCYLEFNSDNYMHILGNCYEESMFGPIKTDVDEKHVYSVNNDKLIIEMGTEEITCVISFTDNKLTIKSKDGFATFQKFSSNQSVAPEIQYKELESLLPWVDQRYNELYQLDDYTLLKSNLINNFGAWQQEYKVTCSKPNLYNKIIVEGISTIVYSPTEKAWKRTSFNVENKYTIWNIEGLWRYESDSCNFEIAISFTDEGKLSLAYQFYSYWRKEINETHDSIIMAYNSEEESITYENIILDGGKYEIVIHHNGVTVYGQLGSSYRLERTSEEIQSDPNEYSDERIVVDYINGSEGFKGMISVGQFDVETGDILATWETEVFDGENEIYTKPAPFGYELVDPHVQTIMVNGHVDLNPNVVWFGYRHIKEQYEEPKEQYEEPYNYEKLGSSIREEMETQLQVIDRASMEDGTFQFENLVVDKDYYAIRVINRMRIETLNFETQYFTYDFLNSLVRYVFEGNNSIRGIYINSYNSLSTYAKYIVIKMSQAALYKCQEFEEFDDGKYTYNWLDYTYSNVRDNLYRLLTI